MKKLLCGFAWILFGIAMLLTEFADPWIPIFDWLPFDWIGMVSAIIGLIIVIRECKKE